MDYIEGKVLKNLRYSRVIDFLLFLKVIQIPPNQRYTGNLLKWPLVVPTYLASLPSFSSNWVPPHIFSLWYYHKGISTPIKNRFLGKNSFTTGGWWVKEWLLISNFSKAWECRKQRDPHYNPAFSAGAIMKDFSCGMTLVERWRAQEPCTPRLSYAWRKIFPFDFSVTWINEVPYVA